MDHLIHQLYLEKLSREKNGWAKNPTCVWNTVERLENAFLTKYPEFKSEYKTFKRGEETLWGELYSECFQKDSLSKFVMLKLGPSVTPDMV